MSEYTDKQLLEWAAKAAGYVVIWLEDSILCGPTFAIEVEPGNPCGFEPWNPFDYDGDAFRLAGDTELSTGYDCRFFGPCAYATYRTGSDSCNSIMQPIGDSGGKRKAMRIAIVRAAAEIGRAMP